jgi:hypothetical protein
MTPAARIARALTVAYGVGLSTELTLPYSFGLAAAIVGATTMASVVLGTYFALVVTEHSHRGRRAWWRS